jgi:hypothetical protein
MAPLGSPTVRLRREPDYVLLELHAAASKLGLSAATVMRLPRVQALTRSWPDGTSYRAVRVPVAYLVADSNLPAPRA